MIFSKNKLKEEIHRIKDFIRQWIPRRHPLKTYFQRDLSVLQTKSFRPDKCTVYLRSPFIGSASLSLESNVKSVVENCYSSVITRVVHVTKRMLSPTTKDLLYPLQKSSVIYEYKCHWTVGM